MNKWNMRKFDEQTDASTQCSHAAIWIACNRAMLLVCVTDNFWCSVVFHLHFGPNCRTLQLGLYAIDRLLVYVIVVKNFR